MYVPVLQVLCELRELRVLYLHGNSIFILSEVDRLGVLPHLHTITLHGNVIETHNTYRWSKFTPNSRTHTLLRCETFVIPSHCFVVLWQKLWISMVIIAPSSNPKQLVVCRDQDIIQSKSAPHAVKHFRAVGWGFYTYATWVQGCQCVCLWEAWMLGKHVGAEHWDRCLNADQAHISYPTLRSNTGYKQESEEGLTPGFSHNSYVCAALARKR